MQNLDIKNLSNEKKEALAAQCAAESILRRVYADQKDHDSPPIESIIAPLEAEIKMYKNEVMYIRTVKTLYNTTFHYNGQVFFRTDFSCYVISYVPYNINSLYAYINQKISEHMKLL